MSPLPKSSLSPRSLQILLIEDNPSDARLILELLSEVDATTFSLRWVDRLASGLESLSANPTDLVMLDMILPDSAGPETFAAVRQHSGEVPIVIMSGSEDMTLAQRAVREGAEDYLVKGQLDGGALARSLRFAVERSERRRFEQELRVAEEQFRLARSVQQHLFPAQDPLLDGFDIAGATYPAQAAGGDYFDYIAMPEGRLGIVIGDVSGHGLGPALLMAETRAYLRVLSESQHDVGEILTQVNRLLVRDTFDGGFVTLFLGCLDPRQRTLVYASGGHRCYHLSAAGGLRILESTGPLLGVAASARIATCGPMQLAVGDLLLMLTDGVLEAASAAGRMFSPQRAGDVAWGSRHGSAREIVDAIYQRVSEFADGQALSDDVTAVVAKVVESRNPEGPHKLP